MADELTITVVFALANDGTSFTASLNDSSVDVTGTHIMNNRQVVGSSEEALLLGDAGVGGYFFAINRGAVGAEPVQNISIRQGTNLTDLILLAPGECCLFRIHGDSTAPFVIADVNATELEYWLVEA